MAVIIVRAEEDTVFLAAWFALGMMDVVGTGRCTIFDASSFVQQDNSVRLRLGVARAVV